MGSEKQRGTEREQVWLMLRKFFGMFLCPELSRAVSKVYLAHCKKGSRVSHSEEEVSQNLETATWDQVA